MPNFIKRVLVVTIATVCLLTSGGQFPGPSSGIANAANPFEEGNRLVLTRITSDQQPLLPSNSENTPVARIGVLFDIEPGWHIYWRNSGEAGVPTAIQWQLPAGWRVGELRWPAPIRFEEKGEIVAFGYSNQLLLSADLYSPPVVPTTDQPISISAQVSFLVCRDSCIIGRKPLTQQFTFSSSSPQTPSSDAELFRIYQEHTPRSIEEVRKIAGFGKLDISAGPVVVRNSGGGATNGPSDDKGVEKLAALSVRGLPKLAPESIATALQLFPYNKEPFLLGPLPSASTVGSTADSIELLLTWPIKPDPDPVQAGQKNSPFAGILVLAGPAFGLPNDLVLEWSERSQPRSIPPINSELLANGTPLTHRFVKSHEAPLGATLAVPRETDVMPVTLLFAVVSAFLAGLVLNLMPCVLPIISIKVMSFVDQANKPRRVIVASALAYAAGILCTFLTMALTLILLKPVGYQVGWGVQFQQPPLVVTILAVVFVLSLAFFDLYHIQLPGMQGANRAVDNLASPILKHFFDGVLATALSTPCSAPFLGTALTFAFTQPPLITAAIFLFIGLGLSLPYVILAVNPKLARFLPRPGDWMFRFRQFLGFLLLGTAVWLLFVLNSLTDQGVVWAVALLLAIYFAFWLRGWLSTTKFLAKKGVLLDLLLLTSLVALTSHYWPELTTKRGAVRAEQGNGIPWQPFSAGAVNMAGSKKQAVFIDFTADWCITCKANEKLVIGSKKVAQAIAELGVLPLKADWTTGDERITTALQSYGGFGVPYYVVIPADGGTPVILPTLLTPGIVIDALREASKK